MTRLERLRSPLLWLIAPLVVGFLASFLLPKSSPILAYVTEPLFFVPLVTWLVWMVAGFINRTNRMMLFYRLLAIGSLSWLFHTVLPASWPWWITPIIGVVFTAGLSIGLDLLFRPHTRASIQTRSVPADTATATQGRREEVAIGLNLRSPDGQAAFVDAGTTVANMGLQAQANLLAAANQGRQIDAEQRRLVLEHLKQVIDNPSTDELTRTLAKKRYYALLDITNPAPTEQSSPTQPRYSSWTNAPYTRGKGVRK